MGDTLKASHTNSVCVFFLFVCLFAFQLHIDTVKASRRNCSAETSTLFPGERRRIAPSWGEKINDTRISQHKIIGERRKKNLPTNINNIIIFILCMGFFRVSGCKCARCHVPFVRPQEDNGVRDASAMADGKQRSVKRSETEKIRASLRPRACRS